jgi:hypothetical protein
MSRVLLEFGDAPDGAIRFDVKHLDGFDATSPAHKLSVQVIKWLDEQAVKRTIAAPVIDTAPTDELQNGRGRLILLTPNQELL